VTSVLEQTGTFSPEALAERLGPEVYAMAIEAAASAPAPSAAKVERVRRILAPAVARAAKQQQVRPVRPELSRAA